MVDVQARSQFAEVEKDLPPITVVLITGFDGKPVDEVVAVEAHPFEAVELAGRPLVLDDEADRLGVGTLRRVWAAACVSEV